MVYLYDTGGRHIANEHGGYLFLSNGELAGRYMEKNGVFASLNGHYLGEIICMNRLLFNRNSRYLTTNFGECPQRGSIGAFQSPKVHSPIIPPPGLEDISSNYLNAAS